MQAQVRKAGLPAGPNRAREPPGRTATSIYKITTALFQSIVSHNHIVSYRLYSYGMMQQNFLWGLLVWG